MGNVIACRIDERVMDVLANDVWDQAGEFKLQASRTKYGAALAASALRARYWRTPFLCALVEEYISDVHNTPYKSVKAHGLPLIIVTTPMVTETILLI